MNEPVHRGLLPAGLRDVLPPDAAYEAAVAERLLAAFAAEGYERVKPPLVEFEDSLFAGAGAAMASLTFRLMDPASQRMMGLRADITPQVARLATTRLARAPRPLRLSYAGEVLSLAAGQLRPEREFAQVGAELIGARGPAADAEAIVMAADALGAVGVRGLTVDLTEPTLVSAVCEGLGMDADAAARAREALDRKDAAAVAAVGGPGADLLGALLRAAGPCERALDALAAIALPPRAVRLRERLAAVIARIREAAPGLALTIDPVEHRGFEYQTGVSFTLFADGVRGELGRGGRYRVDGDEPAVGFTLFMDSVMRALPPPEKPRRLYLPAGTDRATAQRLRAEGWVAIAGLEPCENLRAEAARLGCGHVLIDGRPVAVDG